MLRSAPRLATIALALVVGLVLPASGGGQVRAQSQLGTPGTPVVPAPTPPAAPTAPTAPTAPKPTAAKPTATKAGESKAGESKAGESKAGESKAGHRATTPAHAKPKPAAPARHVPVVGAGKRPERVAPPSGQPAPAKANTTKTSPSVGTAAHDGAAAKPAEPAKAAAPAETGKSAASAEPGKPPAPAEPDKGSATGLPLPRFAALRSDEVNLRAGPGTRYPITWVYKRRNLPVKIEREFEVWRLIEDADGVKGWVHQATLTGRRGLLITGAERTLRAAAADGAAPVARLKPGVVGQILHCDAASDWCQVQVKEYRGFLRRSEFWGTTTGEAVN